MTELDISKVEFNRKPRAVMQEMLKPLNDYILKKLFGENEVKDNLVAFLNRKDRDRLVILEIVDNYGDCQQLKER